MTIYEIKVRAIKVPKKKIIAAWSGTAKQLKKILMLRK